MKVLVNAYQSLGDYQKAIENHKKRVKSAIEIVYQAREGRDYGNHGNAYQSLGDYPEVIQYPEKLCKTIIAIEIGDRTVKGGACRNFRIAYMPLGDCQKAMG